MLITKRYATIPMTAAARQAVRTLYPRNYFSRIFRDEAQGRDPDREKIHAPGIAAPALHLFGDGGAPLAPA
jgi:hypothetical protein